MKRIALCCWLVGCGVDESKFIPDYADMYCQTMVDCGDPAVLVFDGIETKDDCLALIGPQMEDDVSRCEYDPKKAKDCLKGMKNMGCPADGQQVDDILPLECSEVNTACTAPPTTGTATGSATGTATGAATGATGG